MHPPCKDGRQLCQSNTLEAFAESCSVCGITIEGAKWQIHLSAKLKATMKQVYDFQGHSRLPVRN